MGGFRLSLPQRQRTVFAGVCVGGGHGLRGLRRRGDLRSYKYTAQRTPIADLETGTVSAGWGQLAAISHRLGREVSVDVTTGQPRGEDALALWRPATGEIL